MIGICLAVAAVVRTTLPVSDFTLAWMHSVEKIRWEEDYRVDGATLVPVAARVRGSGAGMEPPADAQLRDGIWHYRPALGPLHELRVTLSPYTSDYELCSAGRCKKLRAIVGLHEPIGVVEISACPVVGSASGEHMEGIVGPASAGCRDDMVGPASTGCRKDVVGSASAERREDVVGSASAGRLSDHRKPSG